jgi:hypothetical protein
MTCGRKTPGFDRVEKAIHPGFIKRLCYRLWAELDRLEAFLAFFDLAFDRFEGGFLGAEGFGDADFAGDGDEVVLAQGGAATLGCFLQRLRRKERHHVQSRAAFGERRWGC